MWIWTSGLMVSVFGITVLEMQRLCVCTSDTNLDVDQPRITSTHPPSASLPPYPWGAPCPHPGQFLRCSPSSSATLWASGTWWEILSASLVCSGLATIHTWPWAGHGHQEKVPGARHRVCSQHQSQMPSSIFVYILIFKPSHSTEHSVLVVVQRERLTKNTNHISGCCFLSIYRLYFYWISSYLKLIPLF